MDVAEWHAIVTRLAKLLFSIDANAVRIMPVKWTTRELIVGLGFDQRETIELDVYEDEQSGEIIRLGYGPLSQTLAVSFDS